MAKAFGGKQGANWKKSGMTQKRYDALEKAHKAAALLRKGSGKSSLPKSTTGKTLTLAKHAPTDAMAKSASKRDRMAAGKRSALNKKLGLPSSFTRKDRQAAVRAQQELSSRKGPRTKEAFYKHLSGLKSPY